MSTGNPNSYDAGTVVRLTGTWTDPTSGDPLDPTAVSLRVWPAGQTGQTWTYGTGSMIVKDSTGTYHADVDTTDPTGALTGRARWNYEWTSTGVGQAAQVGTFTVLYPPD